MSREYIFDKWSPDGLATAKNLIAEYKQIRPLVQQGLLSRLASLRDGSNVSSTESVSQDGSSAVVFALYQRNSRTSPPAHSGCTKESISTSAATSQHRPSSYAMRHNNRAAHRIPAAHRHRRPTKAAMLW